MGYTKKSKKAYVSKTKSKKVRTVPKSDSSVIKLQKQINALTTKLTNQIEVKEVDFGIIDNSVAQVQGNGLGATPSNSFAANQLANEPAGLVIPNGTLNGMRIGSHVNLKRFKFRMQVQNQSACITPMKLRFELWQLLGDPSTLMSPTSVIYDSLLPNEFYLRLQGGTPPYGIASIYDTTSLRNTDYKMSNIAKKIHTKHIKIPLENFNAALMIRDINFNVDLKNMKSGFTSTDTLQSQYYMFIFASTGNSSTSQIVDPSYTKGLGSVGINSGVRVYTNIRLEYTDV